MDFRQRFKRWFKLRFAILYPFAVFVIIFANCDDRSIRLGLWFIIPGLLIRTWANGYAIKTDKLSTCGPYSFVRHPLYLGTLFLITGFIITLKIYYLGILLIIIMAIVYYRTIKKEEEILLDKFKDLYKNYKKKVPSILPTIFPYLGGKRWSFSFRRLIKSQEYKLVIWATILILAFHIKQEMTVERETINAKTIRLIVIALSLGLIDLVGEILRNKIKKYLDAD